MKTKLITFIVSIFVILGSVYALTDTNERTKVSIYKNGGVVYSGYITNIDSIMVETKKYTVSVSSTAGGTATVSSNSVESNGSVTLTATPNSGYRFVNWTLNGNVVSTSNPYTATITENSEFVANFEAKKYYTVSVSSTAGGTATVSSNSVESNGSVTLTATPNSGYRFVNWTLNGNVVSTSNPYTATITENSEFVANFEKIEKWFRLKNVKNGYYLSFTNHNSYTTNSRDNAGMGVIGYADNEDQLFKFESADNGKFYIVSKSGYYIYCTYWQCHAHKTLKTQFTVEKSGDYYTIYQAESLDQGAPSYGYLAPQETGLEKIVYCDNPATSGYKTWYLEDSNAEKIYFTVSVNTSDTTKGTATVSSNSVESNGSVTLTATPNSGYQFVNWTLNGNVVSTSNPYTAIIIENSEFVANFETKKYYTVSVFSTIGGSATTSSNRVESNGSVTLTATPFPGYQFVNWTSNGNVVSTSNPYTATITENSEFVANFKEIILSYCTPTENMSNGVRRLESFTIGDSQGNNLSVDGIQPQFTSPVYVNKTDRQLITLEGETLNFKSMDWKGEWMHAYVYIDYNKDGEFNQTNELVSYNFYSSNSSSTGVNSKGTTVQNNCGVTASNIPSWTIPTDLPEGTYRLRLKIDWNNKDACGSTQQNNDIATNGGCICDMSIYVKPAYTVSVSSTTGGSATTSLNSVESNGSVTLTATPFSGYQFVNWTLNGNVVSISNPYTATITENSEFVANFEEIILSYCTPTENMSNGARRLESFTIGDSNGNNLSVDGIQPQFTSPVYVNKTDRQLTTIKGETLNFKSMDWKGEWMHAYVYIDYNEDGEFNQTNELVSYNFYSSNSSSTGVNSKGTTVQNNCGVTASNIPSWTIPTDLPEGTYRLRLKIDWNNKDACGSTEQNNDIATNGGCICDISIYVKPAYAVSVFSTIGGSATTLSNSVGLSGGSVTLTATPNSGYQFVNWTSNGNVVSTLNPYTATITEDSEFVANFSVLSKENGQEYVDLGLPSGIKWATCNVGADTPEEYGDYFAWGETQPKDYYDWSNYKYCNGDKYSITKYCTESYYGTVDGKIELELDDDAARVNWGGKWRMPTSEEKHELNNTSNCTWTWTTQNGVNGYKVTSVKNGNFIFLPAAGYRSYNGVNTGYSGYYWSPSLYSFSSDHAWYLGFNSSVVDSKNDCRYYGLSVRAVCE